MKWDQPIRLPEIFFFIAAFLIVIAERSLAFPPYVILFLTLLAMAIYALLRRSTKNPITKEEKKLYAFRVKFRIIGGIVVTAFLLVSYGISYLIFKDSFPQNGFWFIVSPPLALLFLLLIFIWYTRNDPRFALYHLRRITPKRYAFLFAIAALLTLVLVSLLIGQTYIYDRCGAVDIRTISACLK